MARAEDQRGRRRLELAALAAVAVGLVAMVGLLLAEERYRIVGGLAPAAGYQVELPAGATRCSAGAIPAGAGGAELTLAGPGASAQPPRLAVRLAQAGRVVTRSRGVARVDGDELRLALAPVLDAPRAGRLCLRNLGARRVVVAGRPVTTGARTEVVPAVAYVRPRPESGLQVAGRIADALAVARLNGRSPWVAWVVLALMAALVPCALVPLWRTVR